MSFRPFLRGFISWRKAEGCWCHCASWPGPGFGFGTGRGLRGREVAPLGPVTLEAA